MTIKPGQEWGSDARRPDEARRVDDDATLAAALAADASADVVVTGGDLWRTLGRPRADAPARRYPIDIIEVRLDDGAPTTAVSHVVARSRFGGWLRGPVVIVMNAEFLGEWDIAPRGHPNDGRLETFELDARTGVRQRLAIARRLPSGTHLPHPSITVRPARERVFEFEGSREVWLDGERRGRARRLAVRARADAASIIV